MGTNLTPNASMNDVIEAAGIERDPKGNYPAKEYRTCLHAAALWAAVDSALRAKDQEIARLTSQLSKAYQANSTLATEKAYQAEKLGQLAIDKIRVGLESNPHVSENERKRLIG